MGRGNFERGKGRPIVKYWDTLRSPANTAEPIEMPFGFWARTGPVVVAKTPIVKQEVVCHD